MDFVELPKRQWYNVSGPSLDIKIPSSHNASSVQTISLLQCNREYVVHMFSDVPRVIMLDSGTNNQEELSNGSKCSSKLSGLGIENFSLSQVSNNIVYIKGKELSIVNIQSDTITVLVKSNIHWNSVVFNPVDDRCFVAWNNSCICLWNRSSYEYHILQDCSSSNKSKISQSGTLNLSGCVLVNYPEDTRISSCHFIYDHIILFTTSGYYDVFPSNLSPGEYYRSLKSKPICESGSFLLDASIFPITRNYLPNNKGNAVVAVLSVIENTYKISICSLPMEYINTSDEVLTLQSINIYVDESNSQYNAHIIGPNWGDYFAIQIYNQLIVCSVGNELPIDNLYFFPSRLLETATFRPPKTMPWIEGGKPNASETSFHNQIEIFVSNIFGGLESITVPPATLPESQKMHYSSEKSNPSNELISIGSQNRSAQVTTPDEVADDYYSVLMASSSLKGEKNTQQSNGTPKSKIPSNRSDLLSSIFGTLNVESKQVANNKHSDNINNINCSDTSSIRQISEVIKSELNLMATSISERINHSISSSLNKKLALIEQEVKSIKMRLSVIEKLKDEHLINLDALSKIETNIKELYNSNTEKLTNIDNCTGKLFKETKSIGDRIFKISKQFESTNSSSIEDFTQVVADSFGTLTNVVTQLQTTVRQLESQINNILSLNAPASDNLNPPKKIDSIELQIEDALNQKHYDRAFAIAISADQSNISSQSEKGHIPDGECYVLNLAYKFDPCIWLDDPLPISHPVILGISKILSDTLYNLINNFKNNSVTSQNGTVTDLKLRILWIKETIHCFEPFTDALTSNDIMQILNEISENLSKCINLITSLSDDDRSINYILPLCLTDGSTIGDLTSILRYIRRTTRNITSGLK
ncbi:putative coiled coil protein [Cryptosporidium felis]|nr:putative coiled coil protein [Cryptosporidium felis]